jgi:O-antigen ligase
MTKHNQLHDYDTVSRSSHGREDTHSNRSETDQRPGIPPKIQNEPKNRSSEPKTTNLKRAHGLTFLALLVFTIVLYARPGEFYPSALTNNLALVVGLVTLGLFAITQLSVEGTFTARPRELNLLLLFMITALLSIPLAIDPFIAWGAFTGTFIRGILIFIVIINVVRTHTRLKALLMLAVATALILSAIAISDYRSGLMTIEGYRAAGHGSGIFGNTNDMALHLVTMLPISIAFCFSSRGPLLKSVHAICAAVMISGILLSYSRGAFLGMFVIVAFFAFKLARRSRIGVAIAVVLGSALILLLAPSGYGDRLLSMFIPGLDPGDTAGARREEMIRSAYMALRHPLLGVGMGNYQPLVSLKGLVTHNSYTQVAAEMGLTALVLYVMFIVSPLRRLGAIAGATFSAKKDSQFYYLALGIQASLLAYMVSSFFLSVAYSWNVYYLVGYAVCFRRLYEAETGQLVSIKKYRRQDHKKTSNLSVPDVDSRPVTA